MTKQELNKLTKKKLINLILKYERLLDDYEDEKTERIAREKFYEIL